LGKPSIFSREYEKKMRKRRRNTIIISLAILAVISGLIIRVICNPIDYANIRKNIQAWIDSDTTNVAEKSKAEDDKITKEEVKEPIKEETIKPVEESINVVLISGNTAKAIYTNDNNGGKIFKTLETIDKNVTFNISPSGKQMIVTDNNSVITLYNVDGTSKVVSKDQYVSTSGNVFPRVDAVKNNPQYLWNVNAKFINEEKIIFVTNRPYFGAGNLKQYIWISDLQEGTDQVLWDLSGASVEIGEKEEKGVKITVDGRIYYIDINGNYVQ
jgi:hypothetical protein